MSNDLERGYAKGIEQYPVYSPTVKLPEKESEYIQHAIGIVDGTLKSKAEQKQVNARMRRIILDEIVYSAADSLLAHGVDSREFHENIIPRLKEVFEIFMEYESRHKTRDAEEWHCMVLAAEREAAIEKGEVIAWSARNIL